MHKINFIFILLCFFLIIFKFVAVYLTNFDLFGDEAQYWLWSQDLNLGYYSKPPLLSWLIALTCSIFGSSFFVIKAMPITIYFFTAVIVFFLSHSLVANKKLSYVTSITFFLMPAVSFSYFLI